MTYAGGTSRPRARTHCRDRLARRCGVLSPLMSRSMSDGLKRRGARLTDSAGSRETHSPRQGKIQR
jgi:hypothetical protein